MFVSIWNAQLSESEIKYYLSIYLSIYLFNNAWSARWHHSHQRTIIRTDGDTGTDRFLKDRFFLLAFTIFTETKTFLFS